MNLTVTQNVNQLNVTVTQSNTVVQLQPIVNITSLGAVTSVNGQTGVVVLDANDIGAPSGSGTSTGVNTGDQDISGKEDISNKITDFETNKESLTLYANCKAVNQWVSDNFQAFLNSGSNIKTYYSSSILGSGELANQKTISSSVTLDDTYNGAIVKVKATATITIPSTLATNFNCVFDVWTGATATFALSGGATIDSSIGTTLAATKMATLYKDGATTVYRLKGELS